MAIRNKDVEKLILEYSDYLLINSGTHYEDGSHLEYMDSDWWVIGQVDHFRMARANQMGDARLFFTGVGISYKEEVKFLLNIFQPFMKTLLPLSPIFHTGDWVDDYISMVEKVKQRVLKEKIIENEKVYKTLSMPY